MIKTIQERFLLIHVLNTFTYVLNDFAHYGGDIIL